MVRGRGRDGEGMRLPADRGSWVDNACAIQDDAGMPLLQSGVLDRTLETKWSVFVKLRSKGPRAVACVKWFLNAGVCWTSTVATDHLLFSAAFCDRPAQLPRRWPWGLQQHEWVPILPCRLYASRTLLCRVACGRGHVYPTAYCFAGFCQLTAFMQPANIVRRFQEACKIVLYRTSDWIHDCKHPSPPPFSWQCPLTTALAARRWTAFPASRTIRTLVRCLLIPPRCRTWAASPPLLTGTSPRLLSCKAFQWRYSHI